MNKLTNEQKLSAYKPFMVNFETKEILDYYKDMVCQIPDYIFLMPSSTSGKYHNAQQCEMFGQLYHELMFQRILEYRLALDYSKEKYPDPYVRDCMRCIPAFHDAIKSGFDANEHSYSVFEHPLLASKWVLETTVEHDIADTYKQMIADMCASHSGQYTTSKRSSVVLPTPKNDMEFFIHECDILSSRADIDMIIPNEYKKDLRIIFHKDGDMNDDLQNGKSEGLPDINTYTMTFGKYNGKLLVDILKTDKGYLNWLNNNCTLRTPLDKFIPMLLNDEIRV